MFLWDFFRKHQKRIQKKLLVQTLIKNLDIHEDQKHLYLDSLDFLSDGELESFYRKLTQFISGLEKKYAQRIAQRTREKIDHVYSQEEADRERDRNSLDILLDNL